MVYGARPYTAFETAILDLYPTAKKRTIATDWQSLFNTYPGLTRKEFAALAGISTAEAELQLNNLEQEGKLKSITSKNGKMWQR